MKNYPRIYSLSTIGIRQHQEFDYKFHPFRTDFVGDSGCGKSMIADLLQLIFVGSEFFVSPTPSAKPRLPSGMVLPVNSNFGAGIGFAILNIETSSSKYLGIGICIEQGNNATSHFIVQQGYDENAPIPYDKVLAVTDLITEDKLPNREDFIANVTKQKLVYKPLQRKKFHQWLYAHQILPVDLSESERILKDYAHIIQSFSRGQSLLKIGESDSLKEFLFGTEKAKEMLAKYKKAVAELQTTTIQYGRNKKEINDITDKLQEVLNLRGLKEESERLHHIWLYNECVQLSWKESETLQSLKEEIAETKNGLSSLECYEGLIKAIIEADKDTQSDLENRYETAGTALEKVQIEYSVLRKAVNLITLLKCRPDDELKTRYKSNQALVRNLKLMKQLSDGLKTVDIITLFEQITTTTATTSDLINELDYSISTLESKHEAQSLLLQFASINQEGTLGRWAIDKREVLNKEIESIIMHYKALLLERPDPNLVKRFIANPSILLRNPDTKVDEKGEGFWLSLNGLEEYIPYVPAQFFSNENIYSLTNSLEDLAKQSQQSIELLEKAIDGHKKIKLLIINLPFTQEALVAYKQRNDWMQDKEITELNISEEELSAYLTVLGEKARIEDDYTRYSSDYNHALLAKESHARLMGTMKKMKYSIEETLTANNWTERYREIEKEILLSHYNDPAALKRQIENEASRSGSIVDFYAGKISDARGQMRTLQIRNSYDLYKHIADNKTSKCLKYEHVYHNKPLIDLIELNEFQDSKNELNYSTAITSYNVKFDAIVTKHCSNEAYRFSSAKDYQELWKILFPDVFSAFSPDSMTEVDAVQQHLEMINEKNKELDKRKLQKINDLLEEVNDQISERVETARKIDLFLNNAEREISAGHRARLKREVALSYPKEWITKYLEKMQDTDTLFGSVDGEPLTDVAIGISIEEKLLSAFYTLSGNRNLLTSVDKLLDPNSYFDLAYSMESTSGRTNIGSAGQTYTAIALLCIARLSLVQRGSKNIPEGLRFMPIDEAEGLGSNFDLLYDIAKSHDYQIISMSINPVGRFKTGDQYLYGLRKNLSSSEDINSIPMAIYSGPAE